MKILVKTTNLTYLSIAFAIGQMNTLCVFVDVFLKDLHFLLIVCRNLQKDIQMFCDVSLY